MRSLLILVFASVVMGAGAGQAVGLNAGHTRDLVEGILEDVGGILNSLRGGPDDPNSPVTNRAALAQDEARLDAAERKANELESELSRAQDGTVGRDHP
ncbi:MAG: hypothetical protein JO057_09320 [Chloroflexi bacterium]|nr:hypothetical protein [Chloroflexota bacterium]